MGNIAQSRRFLNKADSDLLHLKFTQLKAKIASFFLKIMILESFFTPKLREEKETERIEG